MILEKPCILSTSWLTKDGYSQIKVDGKLVFAHRHALEQKLGRPIRDKHEACHHCDTPNCIEQEHLFEGTHAQNLKDAWLKGRRHGWRTEDNFSKTHCSNGHSFAEHGYIAYGYRRCRECKRQNNRDHALSKRRRKQSLATESTTN